MDQERLIDGAVVTFPKGDDVVTNVAVFRLAPVNVTESIEEHSLDSHKPNTRKNAHNGKQLPEVEAAQ